MVCFKKIVCRVMVFSTALVIFGCGKSNQTNLDVEETQGTIKGAGGVSEETVPAEEQSTEENRSEEWPYYLDAAPEEMPGNILGYTLQRIIGSITYVRDDDYLVDKSAVGKGVCRTENISEAEALVGQLMTVAVESRGEVQMTARPYFSDWAVQQLQETDWEALDKDWQINPYEYDREYTIHDLYGATGYNFRYVFYPNEECRHGEETQTVTAWITVNPEGIIDGVKLEINQVQITEADIEVYVNSTGLFDDAFCETVIEGGQICEGKVSLDFYDYFGRFLNPGETYEPKYPGLLASADAAASAEKLGKIFINMLESRGEELRQYQSLFAIEKEYIDFKNDGWNQLEENWKASAAYDCYYIDGMIDSGFVVFRYCFYPDYVEMDLEEAKAVLLKCYVDVVKGEIYYVEMNMISMTREEYGASEERKKEQEQRSLIIKEGKRAAGNEKQPITVRRSDFVPCLLRDYRFSAQDESVIPSEEKISVLGMEDRTELAEYLGQKLLQEFEDNAGKIKAVFHDESAAYGEYIASWSHFRERAGGDWRADAKYDCFYMESNERDACVHLKYYFYPVMEEGIGEGHVMVLDVYLSGSGIEDIVMNRYRTQKRKQSDDKKVLEAYQAGYIIEQEK